MCACVHVCMCACVCVATFGRLDLLILCVTGDRKQVCFLILSVKHSQDSYRNSFTYSDYVFNEAWFPCESIYDIMFGIDGSEIMNSQNVKRIQKMFFLLYAKYCGLGSSIAYTGSVYKKSGADQSSGLQD